MSEQAIEAVRKLEDDRCRAITERDFAALDQLLHEDLIYTHSSARTDTKSS